jgi:hypothetical protein
MNQSEAGYGLRWWSNYHLPMTFPIPLLLLLLLLHVLDGDDI